ncbi:vancomycin resistance protein YoaR [Nocardioides salarius]|uniref:Vancomycin resistance protein YoaR n=1 Tax=Nocardioides salarius TaxID=374513 RepID=A0ABS2M7X2_9ACTN|nr:VanW family protein [Nocardioides salarius]MBM7507292.1 vancomycin resistance protein YoaR [Nocardioides salarius]
MSRDPKRPSDDRESSGAKAVVLVLGVLVTLAAGGYAVAGAVAGDKVPRGTTIAGVDVGGRSPARAERTLVAGLDERLGEPLSIKVPGAGTREIDPAEAGLSVDTAASVAEAGGRRSWAPDRLWDFFTGGQDLDPVVDVDEAALDDALAGLADDVAEPAVDGQVKLTTNGVKTTKPQTGRELDLEASRAALVAAYVDQAGGEEGATTELEVTEVEPDIDAADVDRAVEEFANPAMSAPVSLDFGDASVTLDPQQYAPVVRLKAVDGALEPAVKTKKLAGLVDSATAGDGAPVDATVALVDGKPTVVPGKPGLAYDAGDVSDALLQVVVRREGRRSIEVEARVEKPDFTTKDARELQIREQVSTFTTYYPNAEYRNVNIGRAAEIIDGTVLAPGETFSMNDTVGERTRENGFTEGFIISNGILKEDLGGGVSQMATTLFNAAFFAGLEDVEHKPHSFYIDRYPVGREATVAWGAIDLRFKNDTPYGILIDTNVTPGDATGTGVVTATFYSTDYWDISSKTGERYDYTQPTTRTLSGEDCYAYEGSAGFSINVWRYFRRAGESELERTEKFNTVYTPSDGVECKPAGGGGSGG